MKDWTGWSWAAVIGVVLIPFIITSEPPFIMWGNAIIMGLLAGHVVNVTIKDRREKP